MSEVLNIEKHTVRRVTGISTEAKALIEKFEKKISDNLKGEKFVSHYSSINDILTNKYKLENIDDMDFPDYCEKTDFITKSVRGNIQKANGKILSYKEADDIVTKALTEDLP